MEVWPDSHRTKQPHFHPKHLLCGARRSGGGCSADCRCMNGVERQAGTYTLVNAEGRPYYCAGRYSFLMCPFTEKPVRLTSIVNFYMLVSESKNDKHIGKSIGTRLTDFSEMGVGSRISEVY